MRLLSPLRVVSAGLVALGISTVAWPADREDDGYVLVEGDMWVPRTALNNVWVPDLWTDGEVGYVFEEGLESDKQALVLEAMAEWEAVSNVEFRPKENGDEAWMYIEEHEPEVSYSSSAVGMVEPNQKFKIHVDHWVRPWVIVHELGHTLGYKHTQSRADRDIYVDVLEENICDGYAGNFDQYPDYGYYGPYNFGSHMHYGTSQFCAQDDEGNCGLGLPCIGPTLQVREPWYDEWNHVIGQPDTINVWDARIAAFLYPPPNTGFVRWDAEGSEDGSFREPWIDLEDGLDGLPSGGTLWVHNDTLGTIPYDIDSQVWTKPMVMKAMWDDVLIR